MNKHIKRLGSYLYGVMTDIVLVMIFTIVLMAIVLTSPIWGLPFFLYAFWKGDIRFRRPRQC